MGCSDKAGGCARGVSPLAAAAAADTGALTGTGRSLLAAAHGGAAGGGVGFGGGTMSGSLAAGSGMTGAATTGTESATASGGSSNALGGSAYATPSPTPTASGGAASGILASSNTLASPTGLGSSGTGASTTSSGSILGSGTLGTGTMLGTGALGTSGGLPVEHLYSLPGAASGISSRAPPPRPGARASALRAACSVAGPALLACSRLRAQPARRPARLASLSASRTPC